MATLVLETNHVEYYIVIFKHRHLRNDADCFCGVIAVRRKEVARAGKGLGRGIREFKDASDSIKRDISEQINNFEKDLEVKLDEPKQLESHNYPHDPASEQTDRDHNPGEYPYDTAMEHEYYDHDGYNPYSDQHNSVPEEFVQTDSVVNPDEPTEPDPADGKNT